jgi:hypothetical protein
MTYTVKMESICCSESFLPTRKATTRCSCLRLYRSEDVNPEDGGSIFSRDDFRLSDYMVSIQTTIVGIFTAVDTLNIMLKSGKVLIAPRLLVYRGVGTRRQ